MSSSSETAQMTPPVGGDQNRGPQLMAMFWTESAICVLLLALRFYARISLRAIGCDDWMMLSTVVLFVIMTAFETKLVSIGGARHVYYLSQDQILEATKWSWMSQPWGIFLFATGKSAVAILILRILGPTAFWRRLILYFFIVTIFIVNSLGCIFNFVQCNPPRALWTPGLPAECWKPSVQEHYDFFVAAWNILTDVVLALLPVTIFWDLRLTVKKKAALCCLLGLGLIAAVFSGYKIRFMVEVTQRSDFTWNTYDIQAWTGAEAFIMIICGNIPPLQPLWDRHIKRIPDSSVKRSALSSYELSSKSNYSHIYRSAKDQYRTVSAQSTRTQALKDVEWSRENERMYGKAANPNRQFQDSESMHELV